MDTLSCSSFLQKYSLTPPQIKINGFIHHRSIKANTCSASIKTKPHTSKQNSELITGYKKRTNHSLLTTFFNSLDDFVCKFIDPAPLRPSVDPNLVLSGNFSPVDELPPTACQVAEGALPPGLDGAYIRNGPNPQFAPRGPYHLFDGDGMVHAVKISKGEATLCSRYVETYKYTVERDIGSPVVINYFSAYTSLLATVVRYVVAFGRVMSGQYDLGRGTGTANTSVAHFGGKLFALCESDLSYEIKLTLDGDIVTLGRHEAYGKPLESMTAHPKVDRETGEAFAFRHNIGRPFLTYFRIDAHGIKQTELNIFSKKEASLVHDFAITKNYAIFPDSQIVIKPKEIIKGNQPALVDLTKVSRLGIIPRYAVDEKEMWWVEVPGFNILHAVNAWEEDGGDTIVMVAPNLLAVEHVMEQPELTHSSMERIEINVKTKIVTTRRPVSARSLDFGVINPAYVGKKTKYMYAAIVSAGTKMEGVVKVDLSLSKSKSIDCQVASRLYGQGCYGGEPCFVAREPDNPTAEEDDGYILNYVFNEITKESELLVLDAKSPNLDIVAAVKLPQRVPHGFHGTFVRERDLEKL